jgi:hypothetical protein
VAPVLVHNINFGSICASSVREQITYIKCRKRVTHYHDGTWFSLCKPCLKVLSLGQNTTRLPSNGETYEDWSVA